MGGKPFWKLGLVRRQQGATLLEISVSLLVLSIAITGLVGATTIAQQVTGSSDKRSDASLTVSSETEVVAARPLASSYTTIVPHEETFTVQVVSVDVRANILQKNTVKALSGVDIIQQLEYYKANRFLDTGTAPAASGLERVSPITVPTIAALEGRFQVVQQLSSAVYGDLYLRWRIDPLSGSNRLSIAIYQGTPFGAGPNGFSTTAPASVTAPTVAIGSFNADDQTLGVLAKDAAPGAYTIYIFNTHPTVALLTHSATIGCLCTFTP